VQLRIDVGTLNNWCKCVTSRSLYSSHVGVKEELGGGIVRVGLYVGTWWPRYFCGYIRVLLYSLVVQYFKIWIQSNGSSV